MTYTKMSTILQRTMPKERKPILTERQVEKLKTASAVILCLVGVAGIVALSAVAPNAFVALNKIFGSSFKKLPRKKQEQRIAQTFYYMKRRGLIRMKLNKDDIKLFLTRLGKIRLKKLDFQTLQIHSPMKWDKTWWQVAADIPTKKYKIGADMFREKIKSMNFFPLQRTLWFYPFDPRREIEFIADHYGIGRFVTVMEIRRLDKDDESKLWNFFYKLRII